MPQILFCAITWNEGEQQGYIKEGKIFSSFADKFIFEFKKEKGEIVDSDGDIVLYLKGDLGPLNDEDFFGIAFLIISLWFSLLLFIPNKLYIVSSYHFCYYYNFYGIFRDFHWV